MTTDTINASHLRRTYHGLQTPPEGATAETSFGTTQLSAIHTTWLPTLDERYWRTSTRSSRKVMCCTKSSTVTHSRSATVACLTSNRRLMVKINQPYRKRLHHQFPRHATAEVLLTDCPMAGDCLKSSVVYQATVTTEDNGSAQTYVGLIENSFKTRFANHKSSFSDPKKRLSTELSKHVWYLKEAKSPGRF